MLSFRWRFLVAIQWMDELKIESTSIKIKKVNGVNDQKIESVVNKCQQRDSVDKFMDFFV